MLQKTRDFYISQIQDRLVPYWLNFVDREYGGILNCISNDGETLLSDRKFTWSQGRWLYILSSLYRRPDVYPKLDMTLLRELMEETRELLLKAWKDGTCCFLMTREGEWIKDKASGRYDTSIYADCFLEIGLCAYASSTLDRESAELAEEVMDAILKKENSGDYLTEPYGIPEGYISHGIPMILLNTLEEFLRMRERFRLPLGGYTEKEQYFLSLILEKHYDKEHNVVREYVAENPDQHRLLDRHINPGHTLEDVWFWLDAMERKGTEKEHLPLISSLVKHISDIAWDKEEGGLFRFVDCTGAAPMGTTQGTSYERMVQATWDMKLWWPHSEMLYLYLRLYKTTGDGAFLSLYNRTYRYVQDTFPSHRNGEWIQIRRRDGTPEEKVVALPVKDPFHILRDFLKIVDVLE